MLMRKCSGTGRIPGSRGKGLCSVQARRGGLDLGAGGFWVTLGEIGGSDMGMTLEE